MRSRSICGRAAPTETMPAPEGWWRSPQVRPLLAFLAVPLVLVLADVAANRTTLKFLLLPPFGALTYMVIVNPSRVDLNLRRLILAPTAATVIAWVVGNALGYTPIAIGAATLGTLLVMWVLDAVTMAPCLALALLTLLLHREVGWNVGYPIAVFLFTLILYILNAAMQHRGQRDSRPADSPHSKSAGI